jgi:glucose/arabinose dehydrogenase
MSLHHVRIAVAVLLFSIAGCTINSTGQIETAGTIPPPTATIFPVAVEQASPLPQANSLPAETVTPTTGLSANTLANVHIVLRQISTEVVLPIALAAPPNDSERIYVAEKVGQIQILQNNAVNQSAFLDITDRVRSTASEQGLLDFVFDPEYPVNGFFYVDYTDSRGNTVISRFTATDPDFADEGSEEVILQVAQPAGNHNGGQLAFGPDGYLYIALGDGGLANDAFGNAQNGRTLLGSILRIDVHGGTPYSIPQDNPFINNPNILDEIWDYGVRNPWRFSFDRLTGDLYIADVGQGQYEEVDFEPAASGGGHNYGWPIMEGVHCFQNVPCDVNAFVPPVTEYTHGEGCSITGGYVYRGQQFPSMEGIYFFGDYCSGIIWGLLRVDDGTWEVARLLESGLQLSSFGEDHAGELYALDLNGGLYQIVSESGN